MVPNEPCVTAPKNHKRINSRLSFDVLGAGTPLPLNQVSCKERSKPFGLGLKLSGHRHIAPPVTMVCHMLRRSRRAGLANVCSELRIIKIISKNLVRLVRTS